MDTPRPTVSISPDFAIGYDSALARSQEPIKLSNGNHFLLARNGRGKTTLLRTLARTLRQLDGTAETTGRVQYLPEDLRFDQALSGTTIFKALMPRRRLKEAMDLADQVELDTRKPYGKLSTGNRRKTHLILAEFTLDPVKANILLLDEPLSGLDSAARAAFEDYWHAHSENTLRLISCHPDYDAMRMNSALVITQGVLRHTARDSQTWSDLKQLLN